MKSGYQIAFKIKVPDVSNSSKNNSKRWNVLWSLDLLEKTKICMWIATKNLLPIAENLQKMKCSKEPIYQRCSRRVEIISHALLEWKPTKKIWLHASILLQAQNISNQDILNFIHDLWLTRRRTDVELMITYCQVVWCARKKLIFEGIKIDLRISSAKAESVLEAYHRVRKTCASHIHNFRNDEQQKW